MAEADLATKPPPSDAWKPRRLGRRWQHGFFHWLIRVGGKTRGYHMANIVSFGYVLFFPSIRRRCRFYLDRRFPFQRNPLRRLVDTFRLVRTYSSTLIDMKVLEILGPKSLSASCPDHDRLLELTHSERGFVLINAHVGCWQVGMSTLGQFPKAVSILMIPESATRPLAAKRAGIIDPRTGLQSAIEMTDALLRGEIVAMMGDRTFGSDQTVVPAQFLGGQVLLPVTPFRLASATGMPVLVMMAPKINAHAYELRLVKLIEVPTGLGRNPENYIPYTQQFADCLEQFVQQFPWQFFNFYDFWQTSQDES